MTFTAKYTVEWRNNIKNSQLLIAAFFFCNDAMGLIRAVMSQIKRAEQNLPEIAKNYVTDKSDIYLIFDIIIQLSQLRLMT